MAIRKEAVKFWWVWTKTGRTPTYFHRSSESAMKEAKRLAEKHPDKKFIVLRAFTKYGDDSLPKGKKV